MIYNKSSFDLDIIQQQFDTTISLMHARFTFEEVNNIEFVNKYDLLVDTSIILINNNLYQISRKNKLSFTIKYELDKEDVCPYEYENHKFLYQWLKEKYDIEFLTKE